MGNGIFRSGETGYISNESSRGPLNGALTEFLGEFLIYLELSFLFFGRALMGHFSHQDTGCDADPPQVMWLLAWPYGLGHPLNPFQSIPHDYGGCGSASTSHGWASRATQQSCRVPGARAF
jgi:hypothetical protein